MTSRAEFAECAVCYYALVAVNRAKLVRADENGVVHVRHPGDCVGRHKDFIFAVTAGLTEDGGEVVVSATVFQLRALAHALQDEVFLRPVARVVFLYDPLTRNMSPATEFFAHPHYEDRLASLAPAQLCFS